MSHRKIVSTLLKNSIRTSFCNNIRHISLSIITFNLQHNLKARSVFQPVPFAIPEINGIRNKHTGKNNKQSKGVESDSDDGEEDEEYQDEKDSKIIKVNVNSLRTDLLLKAGLGMARNKVETVFYESKIRVNSKKILKKSLQLHVGDEIDLIKGVSTSNPDHIVISRVEILSAVPKNDVIAVKLRRYKSLVIENYIDG